MKTLVGGNLEKMGLEDEELLKTCRRSPEEYSIT